MNEQAAQGSQNRVFGDSEKVSAPVFRGAALEVQSYREREWILAGPAETGKTVAVLWLLDSLLRSTPRANAVLARKIQSTIAGTVLVTYKRIQALRESLGEKPASAYGGEKPEWYIYPNGAKLWIGGMDNANKMLSGERDFIYINQAEELTLEDWEVLFTRCTGRGAVTQTPMLFGDCNPGAEDHWIQKRQTLKVFESHHVDNPSLYDEAGELTEQGVRSMATLQTLTGIRRSRLLDGKWVGAEGLFFEEWDDAIHTCEPFPIPADWPIWGAYDHAFAHNAAFGLFTENDDIIYLIAEHVRSKTLIPFHCLGIRRQIERAGADISQLRRIAAGHDLFQVRGDEHGRTPEQQFNQAKDPQTGAAIGLYGFEHANIARVQGAQELLERLGNKEMGVAPRLQIFRTCPRTIAAITRMVHDPRDPEDVLKVNADQNGDGGDDEYDMLRYGVMGRNSVGWLTA